MPLEAKHSPAQDDLRVVEHIIWVDAIEYPELRDARIEDVLEIGPPTPPETTPRAQEEDGKSV